MRTRADHGQVRPRCSASRHRRLITDPWRTCCRQFNSWDRDPLLYTAEDGSLSVTPKTHQLRGNLIFNANFLGATQSVRRDHRLRITLLTNGGDHSCCSQVCGAGVLHRLGRRQLQLQRHGQRAGLRRCQAERRLEPIRQRQPRRGRQARGTPHESLLASTVVTRLCHLTAAKPRTSVT